MKILNEALPNLRDEVYKTENFSYAEQLERREEFLRGVLSPLSDAAEPAHA